MRGWFDISLIADVLGCFEGLVVPLVDGLLELHRGTSGCYFEELGDPEKLNI